jgi:hypothetical protein
MSHRRSWLTAVVLVLVLAAGVAGWQLLRMASRAEVEASARAGAGPGAASGNPDSAGNAAEPVGGATSPYHASDPALLAATGRPQLVEFYHRL